MFLASNFFLRGKSPEIFDTYFKTERTTDHDAKFRGDRLIELGDLAARKKEIKTPAKYKSAPRSE